MTGVPAHWVEAPLGEICDFINGRAFKPSEWAYTGRPIIRIQNLNNLDAPYNYFDGPIDSRHEVNEGELLFAWSGTPGTSFGAHIWNGVPAVLNQHIFRVIFDGSRIDSVFLKFAINQTLDELIDQAHGGVGLRHITKATLLKTRVRLAPVEEQRRIAEAIAASEARLAAASEDIRSALLAAEQYQKAVLRQVFGEEIEDPPISRAYRCLADLVDEGPVNGWSPRTGPDAMGALTLRLTATTSGYLRLDDAAVKRVYEELPADSRYWLKSGDLLVQRANAIEYLGAAAIFDGPENSYIYPDLMMRLRISDPDRRRYIWRYLNGPLARNYLRERATGTSGSMPKFSGVTLRALPVPLPASQDYRSVVELIDREFATVELARKTANDAAVALEELHRSIIAKAFQGQLLPSDPADSLATALLEKIRQDRAEHRTRPLRSTVREAKKGNKGTRFGEGAVLLKRRSEVPGDHLRTIVTSLGGASSAREVWRKSEMTIDEFYKQLRSEMSQKQITIGQLADQLVAPDAN
ncbi:Type I restriction enzyme StySPI specificity protein [Bosea sp. LC85]|uniref:restriction endonuclease subunit S n=1 Tax=Bosea sp. LC85 TaxID=1502851 RepID=UPI0004E3EEB5|nr:restriction endonuclease subunit S [Bosea sp. LC85]KFC65277.1 Type I restriction enzyme StySPI specificity protein [Bosea sp. LC85]